MLLGDLLDDSRLGLSLLTGRDQLDRAVRGVYITDLIDPRRYLQGGELVLSGLVWHREASDSEAFAGALAEAGVAGLVAGTARLGKAPPDLVEACARHGVLLFELPVTVSFNTLFERVLGAVRDEPAPRRDLVADVAAGADLTKVLAAAAAELGTDCWVCSAVGSVVAGRGELPVEVLRSLVREFLRAERLPRTVRSAEGQTYVLRPVGSGTESRPARWFLVLPGGRDAGEAERGSVCDELATAVALLRTRLEEGRRAASRPFGAAVRGLLDGSVDSREAAARLGEAGVSPEGSLCVVSLDSGGTAAASVELMREIAAATGLPSVTPRRTWERWPFSPRGSGHGRSRPSWPGGCGARSPTSSAPPSGSPSASGSATAGKRVGCADSSRRPATPGGWRDGAASAAGWSRPRTWFRTRCCCPPFPTSCGTPTGSGCWGRCWPTTGAITRSWCTPCALFWNVPVPGRVVRSGCTCT